jgi:hypothetical protein
MRGPRGAKVEVKVETTQTVTWTFTVAELRKRLSLPDDARLYVEFSHENGREVELDEELPLMATATVTRSKTK